MAGIAGIFAEGKRDEVGRMLDAIRHRGPGGREVLEVPGATLGVVRRPGEKAPFAVHAGEATLGDAAGNGHFARVAVAAGRPILTRDPLGVAPLYYGRDASGNLCFASEVKGLLPASGDVCELGPGCAFDGETVRPFFRLRKQAPTDAPEEEVVRGLRERMEKTVEGCIQGDSVGSWLSGGMDSSTLAALARLKVRHLHTFAAGLPGAPDLEFAGAVARFIGSEHHEVVVSLDDLLQALPPTVYHLESFDALLVRSSLTNYLVAKRASDFVETVLSGEAGDELFAGYAYLKGLPPDTLPDELVDIAGRLHNTALQRVDRCASAHGTVARVPFADPELVDYALRIPHSMKLRGTVEKWVLRESMRGALPDSVVDRPKAKFWEGAGVGELLAGYAAGSITDADFRAERALPDGGDLNTKEELLYYRTFREHFGRTRDLSWVGRTKGAPRQES